MFYIMLIVGFVDSNHTTIGDVAVYVLKQVHVVITSVFIKDINFAFVCKFNCCDIFAVCADFYG